jgi:hypothetical protein
LVLVGVCRRASDLVGKEISSLHVKQ